nr:hypothetical protein [Brevibacterium pigmentatum]
MEIDRRIADGNGTEIENCAEFPTGDQQVLSHEIAVKPAILSWFMGAGQRQRFLPDRLGLIEVEIWALEAPAEIERPANFRIKVTQRSPGRKADMVVLGSY